MKKILITAPVHQDVKIFKEYLWSLNRLIIPEGYIVNKYFYLHNADNLKKFLQPNEFEVIKDEVKVIENNFTHSWTNDNFNAVVKMRNAALEKARKENYDYIFSVDSDVILHKDSIIELLDNNCDIVAKIYWTIFDSNQPWLVLPNGYDEINEYGQRIFIKGLNSLKIMGLHEIGITGACTLIGPRVINEPLINYNPISIVKDSKWEDLAFCLRTRCVLEEAKICIDNYHAAKHLYRKEDYNNWIKKEKILWEKEC